MRLIDAEKTIDRLLDASEKMKKDTTDQFWLGVAEGLEDAVCIIKAEMPTIEPVKSGKRDGSYAGYRVGYDKGFDDGYSFCTQESYEEFCELRWRE